MIWNDNTNYLKKMDFNDLVKFRGGLRIWTQSYITSIDKLPVCIHFQFLIDSDKVESATIAVIYCYMQFLYFVNLFFQFSLHFQNPLLF